MMPREIELKFEFNSANERALRRHLRRVCGGKRPITELLVSIYFNTPHLRLFAKGISLRVRRVGKRYRQTIKIADGPATGLFDRAEWEQDIHGPKPDLALVKGDAFADLLNGRHPRSLRPIFETRVAVPSSTLPAMDKRSSWHWIRVRSILGSVARRYVSSNSNSSAENALAYLNLPRLSTTSSRCACA